MAVIDSDDDILRGVNELTCKVSRVSGFKSCIGETFAGAVSGDEILEHGQTLAEVRGDGLLDDFARRFGHLTTHTGELLDLGAVTTRAGIHHHKHGVHVAAVVVVFQRAEEGVSDLFTGVSPDVLNFVFALAIGDDASAVLFFHLSDFTIGLFEELHFLLGHHHVIDTDGNTCAGCFAEAEFLEAVKCFDSGLLATGFVAAPDDVRELFLAADFIVEAESFWPDLVENNPTGCGFNNRLGWVPINRFDSVIGIFEKNAGLGSNCALGECEFDFVRVLKQRHALGFVSILAAWLLRQVIATERNILRWSGDGLSAGWREDVVWSEHEHASFHLRLNR